jgi:uncharacterized protein
MAKAKTAAAAAARAKPARPTRSQPHSDAQALAKRTDGRIAPTGARRLDSLQNVRTGLGIDGRDKRIGGSFSMRSPLSDAELCALWSQSWLAAEIVETVPEHMTRAWLCVTCTDDDDASKDLQADLDVFRHGFKEGLTWGRLFGGALLLLNVDDGRMPDEPIDWRRVRSVRPSLVVDRTEAWPSAWCADPWSNRFGLPELYAIQFQASGVSAPQAHWHAERCLRFDGNPLPRILSRQLLGWSDSVLERVFDTLRDHRQSLEGAAAAAQEFALSVLQIDGLTQELTAPDGPSALTNRVQEFLLQLRCAGLAVIDKSETFTRLGHQVSGLADLIKVQAEDVAGAAGIPRAVLYGQQGGTTRAGADTDVRGFYDRIRATMVDDVVPQAMHLCRLLCACSTDARLRQAAMVDDMRACLTLEPNSLWEPDAKADAETSKLVVDAAVAAVGAGILGPTEVRAPVLEALGAVEDPEFAAALTQDPEPEVDPEDGKQVDDDVDEGEAAA